MFIRKFGDVGLFYELMRLNNVEVYPNFGNVTNVENTVKLRITRFLV